MPIYRFVIHDGRDRDDPAGIELPDDEAARREVAFILRDLGKTQASGRHDWTIEVMDESRLVWKIPFNDR
jgi:hypothetical protein